MSAPPASTPSFAAVRRAAMWTPSAWPLTTTILRKPFLTRSARTSRTYVRRPSKDTLTLPGYGRLVWTRPYGIGGARIAPVFSAARPRAWRGGTRAAPRGRGGRGWWVGPTGARGEG